MSGWFGNTVLDVTVPIPVNITQFGGGAAWNIPPHSTVVTITINPWLRTAAFVRYLLVSEMTEQFMRAQGVGWFGNGTEGSAGEGLSRFLAYQFLIIKNLADERTDFFNSNIWMASSRSDFVNVTRSTDDGPDVITGCSLLFIWYLFTQLGFTLNEIVAAGASNVGQVYKNLTGEPFDPFPPFKRLLDYYYPGTSKIAGPNTDNPFPLLVPRLELFVRGGDRHVWQVRQDSPNGDWLNWKDLCVYRPLPIGLPGDAAVGRAADGRLEIFVRGIDAHLWHLYQTSIIGDWSDWEDLSAYRPIGVPIAGEPAVGRAADGRLEIFVVGEDGHQWHLYQTSPNGDWSDWEDLSVYRPLSVGAVGEPAVGSAADGRLEIFVRGNDGHLWHLYQTAPNGDWSEWEDLSVYRPLSAGVVGEPAVGSAADGRLEIFACGSDGHQWHLYQTSPNGDWSDWEDLSVYRPLSASVSGGPAVGSAADGRLEIFVRGNDGHLWHLYQTTPNGDWSSWEDLSVYRQLGVDIAGHPAVGSAADGRLEVFACGSDGHLWHLYQTSPNGDWSGWEDLSVYRLLRVSATGEPAVGRA
jgi:hypothetical protein